MRIPVNESCKTFDPTVKKFARGRIGCLLLGCYWKRSLCCLSAANCYYHFCLLAFPLIHGAFRDLLCLEISIFNIREAKLLDSAPRVPFLDASLLDCVFQLNHSPAHLPLTQVGPLHTVKETSRCVLKALVIDSSFRNISTYILRGNTENAMKICILKNPDTILGLRHPLKVINSETRHVKEEA